MQEHKKNEYTFLNGNFIYFLNFSESFRELSSTTLHYVPKIVTDLCTMHQHNIINSSKTEKKISFNYFQGRQSVPKSGRSERDGERNFGVAPKNVLLKGYFCPTFWGGAE